MLYDNYKQNGFVFSDEIITRYALSLLTKQFVILSGISGTGKTKIAQLFEAPIKAKGKAKDKEPQYLYLTVSESMRNHNSDGRSNFKFEDLDKLFDPEEVDTINQKIEEKKKEKNNGNICDDYDFSIISENGESTKIAIYLQRASNALLRIRTKRAGRNKFDSRDFFKKYYKTGDVLKLTKTAKNELKIIGKVEDEDKPAFSGEYVNNKCFISVKSNWTDPSEFLGYYNPISNTYVITKALKFILSARDNPNTPFFLILDEMNLAKVEHYFSDFLSCLESRIIDGDNNLQQEAISLYAGSGFVNTNDDKYSSIPTDIEIPPNLYITGTVNIDDTTHMFSHKVLDRANIIEFNDVYIEELPKDTGYKIKKTPDFLDYKKSNFSMFHELEDELKKYIIDIHNVLKKHNLHFGYRTIGEISHYIQNSKKLVGGDNKDNIKALDIQILQKILPKLHGNFSQLQDPIEDILKILIKSNEDYSITIEYLEKLNLEEENFRLSISKLSIMYKNLMKKGYASFIE